MGEYRDFFVDMRGCMVKFTHIPKHINDPKINSSLASLSLILDVTVGELF
jgi:hypothetical protein